MKKIKSPQQRHLFEETPFGPVAILWSVHQGKAAIFRVLISTPGLSAKKRRKALYPGSIPSDDAAVRRVARDMTAYFRGEVVSFSLKTIRLDLVTEFQRKVLLAEYGIPRGRVSTYQRIAKKIGNPPTARAVGTALARNPFPIIIPCHRAVRSDGSLGGYQGGLAMKKKLLEMEGLQFKNNGKIDGACFHY